MSEKYKKTCKYLNYVQSLLILVSTGSVCVSISALGSLVCVLLGITSSIVGIKICAITAEIKKYKSIIKKKKKIHDKIVLLGKDNCNPIEVLISKPIIDSYICHDEFFLVNNVFREYIGIKEEIKKSWKFCIIHYIKTMETNFVSCKENTANKNSSVRKTKQNQLTLLSSCAVSSKKKSTSIKNKQLHNFND